MSDEFNFVRQLFIKYIQKHRIESPWQYESYDGSLFSSSIPVNSIHFLIVQVSIEMGQYVLSQDGD